MPADINPTDELATAEATLADLEHVIHHIASDDLVKQTPCREFDVAGLTDHVMNSITTIGGMAGADFPARDTSDSVERQIVFAARSALDAWHRRGLDGTVRLGDNEAPAKVMVGVLAIEFLVHAWDYARAIGQKVQPHPRVAEYVYGLARKIITPQGRTDVGFDDAIDVPDDSPVFDKLIAFTGRTPA
jgi:uncharacterized protein (TIGR03086 family)